MRIYEGSARRDFEEVFRTIGADLDARGFREILIHETTDGFLVDGLAPVGAGSWSDALAQVAKATVHYTDDEVGRLMDAAIARRGRPPADGDRPYEMALRLIGRYVDDARPRDVFLFEQGGAYVLRMLLVDQVHVAHRIVEFTEDDLASLAARAPRLRSAPQPTARP